MGHEVRLQMQTDSRITNRHGKDRSEQVLDRILHFACYDKLNRHLKVMLGPALAIDKTYR